MVRAREEKERQGVGSGGGRRDGGGGGDGGLRVVSDSVSVSRLPRSSRSNLTKAKGSTFDLSSFHGTGGGDKHAGVQGEKQEDGEITRRKLQTKPHVLTVVQHYPSPNLTKEGLARSLAFLVRRRRESGDGDIEPVEF